MMGPAESLPRDVPQRERETVTPSVSGVPMPYGRPPLVIFGSGGSGTRVVARIARAAGFCMGVNIDQKEDAPEIGRFNDARVNWYLARCHWIHEILQGIPSVPLPERELEGMADELRLAISRHLSGVAQHSIKWGWKTTPSMMLLPFLHQQFPGLKVIHVVRNGLDMAYSGNQNLLSWNGDYILDCEERTWPESVQSMLFWSRTNLAATCYGERLLGKNYLRVRFEDVCVNPAYQVSLISRFLNGRSLPKVVVGQIAAEIESPPTVDRWRAQDPGDAFSLSRLGADALCKFGYLPDEHATVYESAARHLAFLEALRERAKEPAWEQGVREAVEEIARLVPPDETLILVDETKLGLGPLIAGRRAVPFTERQGQYWGPPAHDKSAIREVERLRRSGATFMIVGWPAFWWLDHYTGLRHHLEANYRCVLNNARLVAFDLRP